MEKGQAWGQAVPPTAPFCPSPCQPRRHLPQHHRGGCLRHGRDGAELPGGAGCHPDHPACGQPQPWLQAAAGRVRRRLRSQGGTSSAPRRALSSGQACPRVAEREWVPRDQAASLLPYLAGLGLPSVCALVCFSFLPPGPQAPEAEVWAIPFQRRGRNQSLAASGEGRISQGRGCPARTGTESQRHEEHNSLPAAGEEDILLHPSLSEVTQARESGQSHPAAWERRRSHSRAPCKEPHQPSPFFSSPCHPLSWLSAAREGFLGTARLCSMQWAQPLLIWHPGDTAERCPQVSTGSCLGQ